MCVLMEFCLGGFFGIIYPRVELNSTLVEFRLLVINDRNAIHGTRYVLNADTGIKMELKNYP